LGHYVFHRQARSYGFSRAVPATPKLYARYGVNVEPQSAFDGGGGARPLQVEESGSPAGYELGGYVFDFTRVACKGKAAIPTVIPTRPLGNRRECSHTYEIVTCTASARRRVASRANGKSLTISRRFIPGVVNGRGVRLTHPGCGRG
jgi:hypothetical protein